MIGAEEVVGEWVVGVVLFLGVLRLCRVAFSANSPNGREDQSGKARALQF